MKARVISVAVLLLLVLAPGGRAAIDSLPGTEPLTLEGDIASVLVEGVDRFLLRQLELSAVAREEQWRRAFAAPDQRASSLAQYRERLREILGVVDERVEKPGIELIARVDGEAPGLVGRGAGFDIFAVRWPALDGVHGEGLYLRQRNSSPDTPLMIAVPDADQTPEQMCGLAPGIPEESQFARRLAENGCDVVVSALVSRRMEKRNERALLTDREFLYRPSFILGRHIIGYELQKIFALVDWRARSSPDGRVAVFGWGEGGMLALYAGALDERLDVVGVSGYYEERRDIWRQPIDRNVFGLLEKCGDAELAAMIAPRSLIIEAALGPELTLPGEGGAPAQLTSPEMSEVRKEAARAGELMDARGVARSLSLVESGDSGRFGGDAALKQVLAGLGRGDELRNSRPLDISSELGSLGRQERQVLEIERHTQRLLEESPYVRGEFMSKIKTDSLEAFEASTEGYREYFRTNVIGHFDLPLEPTRPRARKAHEGNGWTGFEVVLDVFPDVIAYGVLLLPDDLKDGERRPVVVCQHGLEGRPRDVIEGDHYAYHDYAAKLAEHGFITFAPQNLYIFKDRFRTLQRKANPLGKTLFSIITPQHRQIVNWLKTLPWVDPERIAFYGLSYGGKTAMRVPALIEDYCVSICSADFNDWVWKNASTLSPYSYVWTGEYEIFEFNLGGTFNYAEMAALIAPRPFMVERGHFDGVAPDERVAYEFAKVRHLYQAKLGMGDRVEIEWFVGPHTINGKGTFEFLSRHLDWPLKGMGE